MYASLAVGSVFAFGAFSSSASVPNHSRWSRVVNASRVCRVLSSHTLRRTAATETFIKAGEDLCGPYIWGKYDLLVCLR